MISDQTGDYLTGKTKRAGDSESMNIDKSFC